jgi:hypothetical protein
VISATALATIQREARYLSIAATDAGWDLDFSEASIARLDQMVRELLQLLPPAQAYPRWPDQQLVPPAGNLLSAAMAYLGETAIRIFGGEWIPHDGMGLALRLSSGDIMFPSLEIYRRGWNHVTAARVRKLREAG